MIDTEQLAAAYVVAGNGEWYVTGLRRDIELLDEAGFTERVWLIKLDNGHRPYAVLQKRISFDDAGSGVPGTASAGGVTAAVAAATGLSFTGDLHRVADTYLYRRTSAFWADLRAAFGDPSGPPAGIRPDEWYAVYRGVVLPLINGIKFVRISTAGQP